MSATRLLSAILTGLLITAPATGCRKSTSHTSTLSASPDTLIPGTVINSAGSWTASTSDGSTKLDLTVSGTSVTWSITNEQKVGNFGFSSGTSSSAMSLSSPSEPWFIFVESPSRLWFFNGTDELRYDFRIPSGGGEGGAAIHSGELSPESPPVPPDLIPRLPPGLRKLFPAVEDSPKRPSI